MQISKRQFKCIFFGVFHVVLNFKTVFVAITNFEKNDGFEEFMVVMNILSEEQHKKHLRKST
jgi:hypothetical protein